MTNENIDRNRFLSVFRREWEMYQTREAEPARTPSGTHTPSSATFDQPVAAGELRIFADFPEPVTGLLLGVSAKGWRIVPLSPFTVPASDREILIGTRVYQLWNACDLSVETASRSWTVDTVPPEDLADLKTALNTAPGESLPADLAACTGLPVTAADDPRRDYERTFRIVISRAPTLRRRLWMFVGPALAASLLLAVALPVLFMKDGIVKGSAAPAITLEKSVPHRNITEQPATTPQPEPPQAPKEPDMKCAEVAKNSAAPVPPLAKPVPKAQVQAEYEGRAESACVDSITIIKSPVMLKSVAGTARSAGVLGCYSSETRAYEAAEAYSGARMHKVKAQSCEPPATRRSSVPRADAAGTEQFAAFKENEFLEVTGNPLSTFGLDVDTASYTTMRRYLTDMKRLPPKDSVRIEEYVNYFSYDYAGPTGNVPVAVTCELGACPWNAAHKLLRVGVQAKRIPKESIPPCNLVFLIDKSGSMGYNGGFTTLVQALRLLVDQLRPEDSVAIVSYASGVQVELPATSGADKARIRQVLDSLRAGGATSGGEGLQLAYEQAMKNFSAKKNNRVVLVTDGDFNVGIRNPSELERYIAEKRATGVFLTVLGVGRGNYHDAMMKKLANAGNGNYAFLDGILEAKKVLMTEFGGTMMTVAKDVKLQLEFNPAQVGAYRLLGYENRLLAAKDFNDDKKDAGEMGSGHSMTAFYELVPAGATNAVAKTDALKYQKQVPVANEELLTVKLRYKLPDADASTRIDQPVVAKDITPAEPSESFRFASSVVEFALLMKGSAHKGSASFDAVIKRARAAKGRDDDGWRAE
ncbi:MAG: von Willebrand factor type A domain-containing protein, partial [Kiritimatiellae bacterium]|nr:von Willebrand factor type A domain-containing protein [Kiritimatiellia bacterium]